MKKVLKNWILVFLYPRPLIGIFYLPKYFISMWRYFLLTKFQPITFSDLQPCLGDWTATTPFDPHYFYQGAWVSRKIRESAALKHVDIASSALMISVLSAFVDTTFVDYRPLRAKLIGLDSMQGNILALPFLSGQISSLSCLHVIEHIGLGRYGDDLDPMGSVKAARELQRVIAPDGHLYVSLPIGRERICFNAHRVHSPESVIRLFYQLKLIDFAYVNDNGKYHQGANIADVGDLEYGCGMFHFQKK
jgi:hypothetical protein